MVVLASYRLLKYNKTLLSRYKSKCKNGNVLCIKFGTASKESNGEEVTTLANGRQLTLSTGRYARFADGSAVASIGDTSVMVTAVGSTSRTENSFLPLVVDFRQKAAAAGRIPTNFLRREYGQTEREILASRFIDRSIRPLFPQDYHYDTQIICSMLALDGVNDPGVIAINGASAALSLSDIPWDGPVGAVRVGLINNDVIINPTRRELQESALNLVVTATKNNLIVMLEGYANNCGVHDLKRALKAGVRDCQSIIQSISLLQKKFGKVKRISQTDPEKCEAEIHLTDFIKSNSEAQIEEIFTNYQHDKISRDKAIEDVRSKLIELVKSGHPNMDRTLMDHIFGKVVKDIFRTLVLKNDRRCDGRSIIDVRKISCGVDLFKPLHGSALFQRGQTQVLCTVTLDSVDSALQMDSTSMLISGIKEKNFFLHYDFPPFATNETKRLGHAGRREVGHGALAEKGLQAVLPKDYPFTIRLTSEVLESNGSSSMATVCGGSLALMDAGIPISHAVAGVAIGLITKYANDNKKIEEYKILTDILGIEDYLGDMDFKIAGTKQGITAVQLDLKIPGIPIKIVMECIQRSISAKSHILNIMNQVLPTARTEHRDKMPVTEKLEVPMHQRSRFIGVAGTRLKKIFAETGVQIHSVDDTTFSLFAPNKIAMDEAKEMMQQNLMEEKEPVLEFGGIYTAKIVEIRDIGIMVTLYPNMPPALLPNSQLDQRRVQHASALALEVGQEIQVKYFGRDPATGYMRISRKVLQEPITFVKSLTASALD